MAAPRKWTKEQVEDVCRRRVQGETTREIGVAVGRNQSVVARLLKAPDVVACIAEVQAGIAATENAKVESVSAERRRATSRKSSAKHRDKAPKRTSPAPPVRRKPPPPEKKRGLGYVRFGWLPDGTFGCSGSGAGDSLSAGESYEEFLTRKDEERDLPAPLTISVQYTGSKTSGTFGLRLWSDDPYDKQDVAAAADMLHEEGCYPSRNAATEAIHETPAGGTLHARRNLFSDADLVEA
jgi:hypothetical protein